MYKKCDYLFTNRASEINGVNINIVEILFPILTKTIKNEIIVYYQNNVYNEK